MQKSIKGLISLVVPLVPSARTSTASGTAFTQ